MNDLDSTRPAAADALFGQAVRERRARVGVTLEQLAHSSGVSAGALSRVERGLLGVSLRNAMAIAQGLGCDLGELVEKPSAQITRAGEHLRFVHEPSQVERVALARPRPGLELLLYRLPPGTHSEPFAAHTAGTREVFHVLEGEVQVWSGAEAVLLRPGDTATLAMDTDHRFDNPGNVPASLILLVAASPG